MRIGIPSSALSEASTTGISTGAVNSSTTVHRAGWTLSHPDGVEPGRGRRCGTADGLVGQEAVGRRRSEGAAYGTETNYLRVDAAQLRPKLEPDPARRVDR